MEFSYHAFLAAAAASSAASHSNLASHPPLPLDTALARFGDPNLSLEGMANLEGLLRFVFFL